ncbi:hypothetical protein BDY19DRAFT_1044321 [Irpex rosettiformis]|uniref:Uncharacterized protein n=1 Tax=Irpex rosettiformis TaxID=378272 RepID=A0ACB8UJL1_9APHY|nr:hypothetical protein BDY19DRAFT_1044321 [Irpex rosettiformis]
MPSDSDKETQLNTTITTAEEETQMGPGWQASTSASIKKRKPKDPQANAIVNVPGKSLFPVSRVQKILKADKDLPMVSREAVLLISLATEEFVKRLAEASHRLAVRENRLTVQRKDVASICRRADEFFFLEELIPLYEPEPAGKRKPKALQQRDKAGESISGKTKTLDQFAFKSKTNASMSQGDEIGSEGPAGGDEDVVMNEDGTMSFGPL